MKMWEEESDPSQDTGHYGNSSPGSIKQEQCIKKLFHSNSTQKSCREALMASLQRGEVSVALRRTLERKDSKLLGSTACERVLGTPEEDAASHPALDFIQQLRCLLGDETAEYFLNPPPPDFQVSRSLQNILDEMEDPLGAEELWRILQARSKQRLKEEYGEPIRPEEINILKNFARRPAMQEVARRRHQLTYIRKVLEHQQDVTNMLLSENPFPDMTDSLT